MNIVTIWGFLKRNFLTKLWFWITLTISLAVMLLGVPVLAPAAQIILGVLVSPFVIILVWLLVLTLNTDGRSIPWVKIFKIFIGVVIVVFIYRSYTRPAAPKGPPPPQTQVPLTIKKVDKERKLYKFSDYPSGCIKVPLESDASFYPKGGWVTIQPPHPAEPWDDAPGILNKEEGKLKPPGVYSIYKKDPNAWGIEIWN